MMILHSVVCNLKTVKLFRKISRFMIAQIAGMNSRRPPHAIGQPSQVIMQLSDSGAARASSRNSSFGPPQDDSDSLLTTTGAALRARQSSPNFGPFGETKNMPKSVRSLARRAVWGEPVSACQFADGREDTGKICLIRCGLWTGGMDPTPVFPNSASEVPSAAKQGIYLDLGRNRQPVPPIYLTGR